MYIAPTVPSPCPTDGTLRFVPNTGSGTHHRVSFSAAEYIDGIAEAPDGPGQLPARRRQRSRGPPTFRLGTFNSTGKAQLEDFMDSFSAETSVAEATNIIATAVQEHWQRGPVDYPVFCERAQRRRWLVAGSPASSGPSGGASAGTGILLPAGRAPAAKLPLLDSWDASPAGHIGRVSAAWIQRRGLPGRGILFISVYAYTGESLDSADNLALLSAVQGVTEGHGGPYIVAGDLQNSPTEVSASSWPRVLKGSVCAPLLPTYSTSMRIIDMFIVDIRITHLVDATEVDGDHYFRGHRPVYLTLRSEGLPLYQHVRVTPRAFSRTGPILPSREVLRMVPRLRP